MTQEGYWQKAYRGSPTEVVQKISNGGQSEGIRQWLHGTVPSQMDAVWIFRGGSFMVKRTVSKYFEAGHSECLCEASSILDQQVALWTHMWHSWDTCARALLLYCWSSWEMPMSTCLTFTMMEHRHSSVQRPGRQGQRSYGRWEDGRVFRVFPEEVTNLACDARVKSGVALNRR